jgi:hypothetical protein
LIKLTFLGFLVGMVGMVGMAGLNAWDSDCGIIKIRFWKIRSRYLYLRKEYVWG